MLFDIIPDTSGYMIAGYAVAFGVMALYLASLIVRTRNLNRDQDLLETMSGEGKPKSAPGRTKAAPKKAKKKPVARQKPKASVKKKK